MFSRGKIFEKPYYKLIYIYIYLQQGCAALLVPPVLFSFFKKDLEHTWVEQGPAVLE